MVELFQQQIQYHLSLYQKIPRSKALWPYLLPQNRPPPRHPNQLVKKQDIGNTKADIEENSPFQENIRNL